MEKKLAIWIEDQNQCNANVNLTVIQWKAKSLFNDLKASGGEGSKDEDFHASRGGFQHIRQRYNFHNIKVTGKAASSDTFAARSFIPELKKIIEEEYSPKQIFNVDKIGLF